MTPTLGLGTVNLSPSLQFKTPTTSIWRSRYAVKRPCGVLMLTNSNSQDQWCCEARWKHIRYDIPNPAIDRTHHFHYDLGGQYCLYFELLNTASYFSALQPGDVILTGTPSGVGPVAAGDQIECTMSDPASGKILSTLNLLAINRKGGYKFTPE